MEYIKSEHIRGFKVLHRGYNIYFNDKYTTLQQLVAQDTPDSFTSLVDALQLKTQPIPAWIKQSPLYNELIVMLSHYIPPTSHPFQSFHHLSIYVKIHSHFDPVTNIDFRLFQSEIKWLSQQNKIREMEVLFQSFSERLAFWVGDNSPMHGAVYLAVAEEQLRQGNYMDTAALVETAIVNYIHLEGMGSLKLVECYILLSKVTELS